MPAPLIASPMGGRVARGVVRRWSQCFRIDPPGWPALQAELDRWPRRGAVFWWRDDDAADPVVPAFGRLLALRARLGLPLGLAVIPIAARAALAGALAGLAQAEASVLVHGWDHQNRAAADEPRAEFARGRDPDEVGGDLARARERIEALFPGRTLPVLVPPFNGLAAELVPAVRRAGFRYVSVDRDFPGLGIATRNVHADVIDWSLMSAASPLDLVRGLLAALRLRRAGLVPRRMPVGVLTHHLAQDDAAWDMTDGLLRRLAEHDAVVFPPLEEVFRA
jgi:peptidoglycan/xylan/chitin deacetylase (PgdA/CDA1 family)